MKEFLSELKTSYIYTAVMSIIFGLTLIIFPAQAISILCVLFGLAVTAFGVISLVRYFSTYKLKIILHYNLVVGLILTVVGIWAVFNPIRLNAIIQIVLGIVVLVHGIIDIQQATSTKQSSQSKWIATLIFGLLSAALGILIICKPFAAAVEFTVIVGILLVLGGLSDIWILNKIKK